MNITPVTPDNADALIDFFGRLPDGDLTFVKEDLTDPDVVRGFTGQQWIALVDNEIAGYVAVRQLPGWSDHVGEVRLVVGSDQRRGGVGRALATHALTEALRDGRRKLVVELAADQEFALAMFGSLGFTGEALLRDHIRDRDGQLRDLVMLAHLVDDNWESLDAFGITEEVGMK